MITPEMYEYKKMLEDRKLTMNYLLKDMEDMGNKLHNMTNYIKVELKTIYELLNEIDNEIYKEAMK